MKPRLERLPRREVLRLVQRDLGLSEATTDEMAIPTHTHANPLIQWLFWRRYVKIAELAEFDSAMSVLEFGCGIGVFLPTLCANAGRVLAVDLYPQYARHLARLRDLDVEFPTDVSTLEDESLDRIIAADVLEHIEDLDGTLRIFRAKLRPGGRLLMSGPTENVAYRVGRFVAGFGDKGDYHLTDVDRLRRAIEAAGFDLGRTRNLPLWLPPHLFRVHEFHRA